MHVSARVVLYAKPGCHLCAAAADVVASVCDELGVGWQEQDISGDGPLMARWGEYVPVVLVDGEVHDWFQVRPDRLRQALS